MLKRLVCTLLFTFLLSVNISAQIKATTEDGRRVILNQDGSWVFDEEKPSTKTTEELTCDDLTKKVVDKMSGNTFYSQKETLIVSQDGTNGFGFTMLSSDGTLILNTKAIGAGSCIDDTDTMNVLFRDKTLLELENDSDFNCDSEHTLYFGGGMGRTDELKMLKTKDVETIRVWTSNGYVEEDFSTVESQKFKKTIQCLDVTF